MKDQAKLRNEYILAVALGIVIAYAIIHYTISSWLLRIVVIVVVVAAVAVASYRVHRHRASDDEEGEEPVDEPSPAPKRPSTEQLPVTQPPKSEHASTIQHTKEIDDAPFDQENNDKGSAEQQWEPVEAVSLSWFARRRIRQQYPDYVGCPAVFEVGKSRLELFIQLDARSTEELDRPRRTWRNVWLRKRDYEIAPSDTIWSQLFWVLLTAAALVVAAKLQIQHVITSSQEQTSQAAAEQTADDPWYALLALIWILVILLLVALIAMYVKWSRWFFWRVVLLTPRPDADERPRIVLIDKPFLLPGGSAPPLDVRDIKYMSSSTAKTVKESRKLRSIMAGWLGIEWITVDSFSTMDQAFHWIGPFRKKAPWMRTAIDQVREKVRYSEY